MKPYDLAIFDMDGTILDTLEDLKNALNHVLTSLHYPTRSLTEVRSFVGNGLRKLVERSLPAGSDEQKTQQALALYLPYYKAHCADKTRPYDGIIELLQALKAKGIKTAVVSNKTDPAVQELCRQYFDGLFDFAIGDRPDMNKKPAPDTVNEALRVLQVPKEKAIYIGDSEVDMQTAKNAGLDAIAVLWGFRDREVLVENGAVCFAQTPADLLSAICEE